MNEPTTMDAVRALRDRGIDNPESLLADATPDQILAACHRWDSRTGVRPGLLVKWIRNGDFGEEPARPAQSKGAQLRARFDEYANRYPVGTAEETHQQLLARRWPTEDPDQCAGDMIVTDIDYPVIAIECDECGFAAAVSARHLHVLGGLGSPF